MAQLEFSKIPLEALNRETKTTLSLLLNPKKVLQSEQGFPRDWRGLAVLSGIPGEHTPAISDSVDSTSCVLEIWMNYEIEKANFECLQKYLERIDRFDVLNDITPSLERDALQYIENSKANKNRLAARKYPPECQVITKGDVYGNGYLQTYNGLLLYSDEDYDFACHVIKEMEKCDLKLCVKDRDLLGGLRSEHGAVLTLLVERCSRLVVILSPEFVDNPHNSFFIEYAQALGIDQGRRKIVPILYKTCNVPALRYYHMLDYPRSLKFQLYNFWDKLRLSIKGTSIELSQEQTNGEEQTEYPEALINNCKGDGLDSAHGHKLKNQVTIQEFDSKMVSAKLSALPVPTISVTESPKSNDPARESSEAPDYIYTSLQNMSALSIGEVDNFEVRSASLGDSPVGSYNKVNTKKSTFKKFKQMFRDKLSHSTENLNEIRLTRNNNKKKKWFKKASHAE